MKKIDQALAHHQAGRLDQAEALYRQILAQQPENPDAMHLLGVIAHQRGDCESAVTLIEQAITLCANDADYHNNLGEALRALDKPERAIVAYRQALALRPDHAHAHNNLGLTLQTQGNFSEAAATFRQALALRLDAETWCNLGNVLRECANFEEAVAAYQHAVALEPHFAEAYNNLGAALLRQSRYFEAIDALKRALVLKPDYAEACYNLGIAQEEQEQWSEAIETYRRTLSLNPQLEEAHYNLARLFQQQGRQEEAIVAYRQALALKPDDHVAHSNLLFCMHYHPAYPPEALLVEAQRWHEVHAVPLRKEWRPHRNVPDPRRRLRLGYVSADLRAHPVGWFLAPVFTHHDREQFELFCYASVKQVDELTAHFRAHTHNWWEALSLSDAALAKQIEGDRIDIVVDLSAGHTRGHRLLTFARKPAPVQVTAGGHFGTTGLDAIDYLIADRYHAPEGAERYFSETLVRMPHDYICYGPPPYAPPVSAPPCQQNGYVTFGCYNNLAKINPRVAALWAEILRALPSSRLRLQTTGLNDAGTAAHVRKMFAIHGIAGERLELTGYVPHEQLLTAYGAIDIALDPFPYSGGLTTCEALWMGVPVITLTGNAFCGRHSTSHLTNVGLNELITTTPEEYQAVALALAQDLERVRGLRRGLRERIATSPLCDAKGYTRDLEAAYREMWENYCNASGN